MPRLPGDISPMDELENSPDLKNNRRTRALPYTLRGSYKYCLFQNISSLYTLILYEFCLEYNRQFVPEKFYSIMVSPNRVIETVRAREAGLY